jgi:hypothetical protein
MISTRQSSTRRVTIALSISSGQHYALKVRFAGLAMFACSLELLLVQSSTLAEVVRSIGEGAKAYRTHHKGTPFSRRA